MSDEYNVDNLTGIAEVLNKTANAGLKSVQKSTSGMTGMLDLLCGVGGIKQSFNFNLSPAMSAISTLHEAVKPVSKTHEMINKITASIDTSAIKTVTAQMSVPCSGIAAAMASVNKINTIGAFAAVQSMCSVTEQLKNQTVGILAASQACSTFSDACKPIAESALSSMKVSVPRIQDLTGNVSATTISDQFRVSAVTESMTTASALLADAARPVSAYLPALEAPNTAFSALTDHMCSLDKLTDITSAFDRSSELLDLDLATTVMRTSSEMEILSDIASASNSLVSGLLESVQNIATLMSERIRKLMDNIGPSMLSCLHNVAHWLLHTGARGLRFIFRRRLTIPKIVYCVETIGITACIREIQIAFLDHAQEGRKVNLIRVQNRGDNSDASNNHTIQLLAA